MSKLGLMFAGAAGAVGAGVASLASRYLDEEMAMNKAQALAELQRSTSKAIREDDDAFRNDPTRVARDRENKRQDVLAAGSAARESELAGLNDANLQGARSSAKDRDAAETTRREGERMQALTPYEAAAERAKTEAREGAQTEAMRDRLPLEVQAAAQKAEAAARASAKYRDRPPGAAEKMADIEGVLGRKLTEPEKLALMGLGKDKGGATEEVDTEYDADGKVVGRKVKTKGPAGGSAGATPADPGAQLRAGVAQARKDGKIGSAIAELEKRGATPAQILAAGVTEDEFKAAKQPTGARASAPAAPREVTPPDSPSGRHQARQQSLMAQEQGRRAQEQGRRAQREQEAQAAFSSLDLRDAQKASDMQQSPLFSFLTREQKAAVQRAVMGR